MTYSVMAMFEVENSAILIAGGVSKGGCSIAKAEGIYAFMNVSGHWMVTTDLGR